MSIEPVVRDAERPALKLRDCYWFFGPLVLMVELNMMSKSVIHGFLARTDNPSTALAPSMPPSRSTSPSPAPRK